MKKRILSVLSLMLLTCLLLGAFAACKNKQQDGIDATTQGTTAQGTTADGATTEGTTADSTTSEDTTGIGTTEGEKEPVHQPLLSGDYAALIENAKWLENGVNAFFTNPARSAYEVTNQNMRLTYSFDPAKPQQVTALTTPGGNAYLRDTMDVYVKMKDGNTYFASNSTKAGTANIYRLGYYYYDVHLANQNFVDTVTVSKEKTMDLADLRKSNDMTAPVYKDGILSATVTNSVDPYIYGNVKFRASDVNTLQLTMRTTHVTEIQLYLKIGSDSFSNERWVCLPVTNDGEWHTYSFELNNLTVKDYSGIINSIRIDFVGTAGNLVEIKELKTSYVDKKNSPELYLDRTLHVYSDKMNHVVRICAARNTTGIEEIGQITQLSANTVQKLIVKDKNGEHTSLDGVDWASAEYIGFDVKGAGIFGYILLKDASSGSMQVTLENDNYKIVQYTTPQDNTILAPVDSNENDFYMGQRIYTDLNHDFDAFRKAAEDERNPLTADNIKVDKTKSPKADYAGYDAIRGAYKFTMEPESSFNTPYYEVWNKHYNLVFDITGDDRDRNVYVMTYAHGTCLENGVLLGKGDMLLPVSLEVCKNFGHEDEEPLFDCGDDPYSETYFPMTIKAGKTEHFTVLNLYQNWGNYPLKQISSIQFFSPYYHLSTGVSESNCISPYYVYYKDLNTLPDHRAMSAPLWSEMENPMNGSQPQHTNGGQHHFLQYTTDDGKHVKSDNEKNIINSYGPTYADIDMTYISDDGKIKVTYNHMEMPQTDENRTYYQMTYEILEDISFSNFKRDFSFYSVRGMGDYEMLGYLDANNQSVTTKSVVDGNAVYYTLGDRMPYFDMFKLITAHVDDYVNVSFLIANAEFTMNGQKVTAPFVIKNQNYSTYLTLDLEQVTLKKGDTFRIDAIIMPWGSQLTDYSTDAPDKNVRDVRANTLLDPVKLDVTVGKDHSSIFLPMVKAEGDRAEFTVSGGENNITLRVSGFTKLTVPKIMEKVNGEWVEYKVNSLGNPDTKGYNHYYDGYMVQYDGDGTFSYSFVVTMADRERTFKVVLDTEFAGWPEDPDPATSLPPAPELPLNMYFTPAELQAQTNTASGLGNVELAQDGSYVRIFGDGSSPEAFFSIFTGNDKETGKYTVIRYRTVASSVAQFGAIEYFSGTTTTGPTGNKDYAYTPGLIEDGEWHVMVFDMEAFGLASFTPAEDGTFTAKFLRLDIFGKVMDTSAYIDVAYVGMDASLDDIKALAADLDSIQLATGYAVVEVVPTK